MDEEIKVKKSRLREAYKKCEGMREFIDIVFPEVNRSRRFGIGNKFRYKGYLALQGIWMLTRFPASGYALVKISGNEIGRALTAPVAINCYDIPDDSPFWGEDGRDAWEEIEERVNGIQP